MSEPASTAAGSALALGAVTITGTILGMHVDALILGLFGSLVMLMSMPPADDTPKTPRRVFGFVAGGSFVAGVFAPLLASFAASHLDFVSDFDAATLRGMCAAIIGGTAHLLLPAVRTILPALLDRLRGGAR